MSNKKIIVTHSGSFHADEVFAVATLQKFLGTDTKTEIIRSREPSDWDCGDFVVDVGGVYDASRNRFDHHQKEGAGERQNGIRYSSFGLVWKQYGEIVCGDALVADLIDRRLVQPIDAHDCGQDIVISKIPGVEPYTIGQIMANVRPSYEETPQDFNLAFPKAVELASYILEREIIHTRGEVRSRDLIREMIAEAPDKQAVEINHSYAWEEVVDEHPEILYVYYQYDENNWRLKAARKHSSSFELRKPLPATWGGKTGEELGKITGVSDATFCHRNLFLCGARSKEGVLGLANIALRN